ncbi:14816_t:CDS:1, partial [Cetraspora pellucida]
MELDKDNEIKRQFLEADQIKPDIKSLIHPNNMYMSKIINTKEIMEISEKV